MRFVLFAGGLAALSGCFLFQQGPTVVEMRPGETMPELRDRVRTLPALKMARALRESKWKTVYGCYAQPDGSFLIGLASARAGGRFRQKISLRRVSGELAPSVPVWKNVSAKRVIVELAEFVQTCLTRV